MIIVLILGDKFFDFGSINQRLFKFLSSVKQAEAIFFFLVFDQVVKNLDRKIIVKEIPLAT